MRATQAKIYLQNLKDNIGAIRKLLAADTRLCLPVKADGYGHGGEECAKVAYSCGVRFFGVATAEEGESVRRTFDAEKITDAHILLFSPFLEDDTEAIVHNALSPFVFEKKTIAEIDAESARQGKITRVHLKIDTGMNRSGCRYEDAREMAEFIASKKNVTLAGTCTHFAVADSLKQDDVDFTHLQFERFLHALQAIKDARIDPGVRHCANSGATLLYPDMHLDMVRPGIACYGYFPSVDFKIAQNKLELKPVMELVTKVSAVKKIRSGDFVSYGKTWRAAKDCYVGILPIGYADGLLRDFAKALNVSISGKSFAVIGRICMDQSIILLGDDAQIKAGDDVSIFGGTNATTAETIAEAACTITYEITCGISKRVKRIFVL